MKIAAFSSASGFPYLSFGKTSQPNIIFIITDQQSATMMSCTGNKYLKTPAMDSLAAGGIRFEKAYSANPVCGPARFSMMSGYFPSVIGVKKNQRSKATQEIVDNSLGRIFKNAGYETVYGGKTHLPSNMGPTDMGFEFIEKPHSKPFFMVASFINPHDICFMAIIDYKNRGKKTQGHAGKGNPAVKRLNEALKIPENVSEEDFFRKHCPPLPDNYAIPELEPEAITTGILQEKPFKEYARLKYDDKRWRLHRWAYCRLTERVDGQIGKVLDAVKEAGLEKNTLIVFTSDHGDMDSAHRMEHKGVLYEESSRIPFIVKYPGVVRQGAVDRKHLVSNGLDLIPTLSDFVGIKAPEGLHGMSVKDIAVKGKASGPWRNFLIVESQIGRMVRTERYKYNMHDSGKNREQLIDMAKDPGEMNNLAYDDKYKDVVKKHRQILRDWVEKTNDKIAKEYIL